MMDPARLAAAHEPIPERSPDLTTDQRQRVALMYALDFEYSEIAHAIGRPLGSVKTAIAALRKRGAVDRRYEKRSAVHV